MNRFSSVQDRAKAMLAGFTPGQRAMVVVAVLALAFGAVAMGRWASQPAWTPLFTNLSGADASAMVEQLRTDGVKYELANSGTTILVPQAQADNLRISMAGKGLTNSTEGNGYSVLDKQGMTATDFQQNIAFQRALQSELSKTLESITGVKTAIVHLAIPKKDVFTTETDHPTASVLLSLKPGTTLSRAQIRSVMHLVSGSVPGLDASDVTVSDAAGNMLSVREDGAAGAVGEATEADHQTQAFEDSKSASLQAMLDKVLGKGKAVVRVNAELNFDASETTSETYVTQSGIPPSAEVTSSESYQPGAGAGGALGQSYPSLTPGVGYGGAGGTYVKVQGTVNRPVGKVVNNTKAAQGGIKRLTVAVVVDTKASAGADAATIQALVSNAVGLNPSRGDTVQVERLEFDRTATAAATKELAQAEAAAKTAQYIDLGKKAGLGLLLLILALVFLRRSRKDRPRIEATASDLPAGQAGPNAGPLMLQTSEEDRLAISAAALDSVEIEPVVDPSLERELLRNEVAKFVDEQPEEIAQIVQGWLSQRKS